MMKRKSTYSILLATLLLISASWANASNTPYRKFKRYMYNGGQLTPFIARWPKSIKNKGAISHEPAHLVDLVPTFLELAKAEYPEKEKWQVPAEKGLKDQWEVQPLAGKSILPIFEGKPAPTRDYFFGHFQVGRMIMKDNWKLVSNGSDGTIQHLYDYPWELYNMNDDPTELNNLAAQHPEMVETMDMAYRELMDQADKLTGVKSHKWFQLRLNKEQQLAADQLSDDKEIQKLLDQRRSIGLDIVDELNALQLKVRTGLGMEKVPMSYFGLVREGRPHADKSDKLKQLYASWDKNIQTSEQYCKEKGTIYLETWEIQERIRPNVPAYEAN